MSEGTGQARRMRVANIYLIVELPEGADVLLPDALTVRPKQGNIVGVTRRVPLRLMQPEDVLPVFHALVREGRVEIATVKGSTEGELATLDEPGQEAIEWAECPREATFRIRPQVVQTPPSGPQLVL